MTRQKTIGVLTGGGDVPGLNPAIKAVVNRAVDAGWRVLGFRRGWAGPLYYDLDKSTEEQPTQVFELDRQNVRTIDRTGGTFLHTSRTNPSRVDQAHLPPFPCEHIEKPPAAEGEEPRYDCTPHVLRVLEHLGVDVMIPIGGDDTLSFAARLDDEGFPIVAIPKTMDNDVYGTDYCIGFSTAVTRSVDLITVLRTPTGSHERLGVVELFGRYSGETSLISAYLADVDRAIISEVPFDPPKLADFLMEDKRDNPSNYAIMTISEGAKMIGGEVVQSGPKDAYGHRKLGGVGEETAAVLEKLTGQKTVYMRLAYLMRSGVPDSLDRMVAVSYGYLATDLAVKGDYGRMVALRDGKYTTVRVHVTVEGDKHVDVGEMYDVENYRPKVTHILTKPMFMY